MELESIMLSEVGQAVKDKYHMISPVSGTQSTEQTGKQNRTRDLEIKNKLTVTRGVGKGDNRERRGRVKSKGPMGMDNGVEIVGAGGCKGEQWGRSGTTVIEQ